MKMIEKIENLIQSRGLTQAAIERTLGLAANRISKWKDPKGQPTATQALLLARFFNVPVEYLVDDEMDEMPQVQHLSEAELRAVEIVRALNLSVQDVIRGLYSVAKLSQSKDNSSLPIVPKPAATGQRLDIGTGKQPKDGPDLPGHGNAAGA